MFTPTIAGLSRIREPENNPSTEVTVPRPLVPADVIATCQKLQERAAELERIARSVLGDVVYDDVVKALKEGKITHIALPMKVPENLEDDEFRFISMGKVFWMQSERFMTKE